MYDDIIYYCVLFLWRPLQGSYVHLTECGAIWWLRCVSACCDFSLMKTVEGENYIYFRSASCRNIKERIKN